MVSVEIYDEKLHEEPRDVRALQIYSRACNQALTALDRNHTQSHPIWKRECRSPMEHSEAPHGLSSVLLEAGSRIAEGPPPNMM